MLLAPTLTACRACQSLDLGSEERRAGEFEANGHVVWAEVTLRGRRKSKPIGGGRLSGRVATDGETWTLTTRLASPGKALTVVALDQAHSWSSEDDDEAEERFEDVEIDGCPVDSDAYVYRWRGVNDDRWWIAFASDEVIVYDTLQTEAASCTSAAAAAPTLVELLGEQWRESARGRSQACYALASFGELRDAMLCQILLVDSRYEFDFFQAMRQGKGGDDEAMLFALASPGKIPSLGDPELDARVQRAGPCLGAFLETAPHAPCGLFGRLFLKSLDHSGLDA